MANIRHSPAVPQDIHIYFCGLSSEKIHRGPSLSQHAGRCGFSLLGVRDKWSQKWLRIWAVPDSRLEHCIAYLQQQPVTMFMGM